MANIRQLFLQHLAQTTEFPLMLEIERGEGCYLYSPSGKKHLDFIAGIGVSSLGHCHPRVTNAIKEQVDKYLHTMVYGEYVLTPQVKLATLMANNLPDPLDSVYFTNSGTEATEGAMKLAKRYTGRSEIISMKHAYHGSSQGAASLMYPKDFVQAYYPLLPGIKHIEFNQEADLSHINHKTAAVIAETVQAEWGIRKPTNDYLKKLKNRCEEVGALLILDEIQAGYGRTGTLWAFQQYGIVPDILLTAKGMGGGMPIGAFIASKEMMSVLSYNPILGHITTFGGHPVSCVAALATLEVLLEENYIADVPRKEAILKECLKHPAIVEVRTAGLWAAVELKDFETTKAVIDRCMEAGLITDWFLFNDHSLRIAPPLLITEKELREGCQIILEAMEGE